MNKLITLIVAACAVAAVGLTAAPTAFADGPLPSLGEPGLASGPFSRMHLLLEKTILKVDVITIDVRVDAKAQSEFVKIAGGKKIEGAVEEQLAKAALAVDNAVVQMKFERDVSLNQWVDQVGKSLDKAVAAGYLSAATKEQVHSNLPRWFAVIKERGFREGDKVLYRVTRTSLRTVLQAVDGKTLLDQTDPGAAAKTLFAGYFAPGTDLRPLLRSLPHAK